MKNKAFFIVVEQEPKKDRHKEEETENVQNEKIEKIIYVQNIDGEKGLLT